MSDAAYNQAVAKARGVNLPDLIDLAAMALRDPDPDPDPDYILALALVLEERAADLRANVASRAVVRSPRCSRR